MAIRQGDIVKGTFPDSVGGNAKPRNAIVITPTAEIDDDASLVGVAITGRIDLCSPAEVVELPWHNDRHPKTKLYKPSVAVTTWILFIEQDEIEEFGGYVPAIYMNEILAMVEKNGGP
jgi:mRNA-degrading endonuclease toxin of MazEF toxin-antitoxin module